MRSYLLAAAATLAMTTSAHAITLLDSASTGLYNDGIGTALNGTSAFFPDSGTAVDPVASLSSAPDLSAASAALGDWLTTPETPGGTWSAGPVAIPSSWAVESETAIIYTIDAGSTGLSNVIAEFGVDNGVLVFLNGAFVGGDQAPGGATPSEYAYALGDLAPGAHYLQVLREDHGGGTGYSIEVTGDVGVVPLPAAGLLLIGGLAALGWQRRRAG